VEDCLPWVGPHAGAEEEREEEGEAERTCDEQTTTHIPCPPAPLGGGGRETGVKLSPRRRAESGEGVLGFGFSSHYPALF